MLIGNVRQSRVALTNVSVIPDETAEINHTNYLRFSVETILLAMIVESILPIKCISKDTITEINLRSADEPR